MRRECELLALRFLRDNGPHTLEPINSEEELAAGMVFISLLNERLVTSTKLAPGYVQFAITDAGRREIDPATKEPTA